MGKIAFVAIPVSFKKNKHREDGGGFKFTLDLDESQSQAWKDLSDWSDKLVKFTAEFERE